MPRRTSCKRALIAALAASAVVASPAFADPVDPSVFRSDSPAGTSTRTWSPGDNLPAYPTPEPPKDAAVQPGQPTWPLHPKVLTPPKAHAETSAPSDDDGIWLVVGLGLSAAALAGGAGAARYARVRARRVAV